MKRLSISAAIVMASMLACGKDGVAPPPVITWAQYATVSWSYAYAEPGYNEWLDSVGSTLLFERLVDSARVRAEANVVGYFGIVQGVDTSRAAALIWRPSTVLRGIVTPGDTFHFVSANAGAWPSRGEYRRVADTLFYAYVVADSLHSFALRVRYQRR